MSRPPAAVVNVAALASTLGGTIMVTFLPVRESKPSMRDMGRTQQTKTMRKPSALQVIGGTLPAASASLGSGGRTRTNTRMFPRSSCKTRVK